MGDCFDYYFEYRNQNSSENEEVLSKIKAMKLRKKDVEDLLEMPEGFWHMHAMIPIGYPTGRWGMASRQPAHEFVYSEKWDEPVTWEAIPNWEEPEGYGRDHQ